MTTNIRKQIEEILIKGIGAYEGGDRLFFSINPTTDQIIQTLISSLPDKSYKNGYKSGWSSGESGDCCDECAMREEHFDGRADGLKALVGCRNPFQVETSCQCHIPHRKGWLLGYQTALADIKAILEPTNKKGR